MADIHNAVAYARYETAVAEFIAREQLSFLSTGCWNYETDGDRPEDYEGEPWFSWSPCECCGDHLGGNREYLYARNAADELAQFEVCRDCVYYVNYGRLDDLTMERLTTK